MPVPLPRPVALFVLLAAAARARIVAADLLTGHHIYPFGGLPAVIIRMEIPVIVAISKGRNTARSESAKRGIMKARAPQVAPRTNAQHNGEGRTGR